MPNLIEKARQQAETARERLNDALLAGTDTASLRAALDAAETKLHQLEIDAARPVAADDGEQRQAAALALVRDAQTAIAERLADRARLDPPGSPDVPSKLALTLIDARLDHERQQAAIAEHSEQAARIQDRIAAVERQREGITARRLAGDERPDDAATVALLTADREGLQRLLSEHNSRTPPPPVDLAGIEKKWADAVLAAESTSLREYAARVQGHLIDVALELSAISRRLYGPAVIGCRLATDHRLAEAARRGLFG